MHFKELLFSDEFFSRIFHALPGIITITSLQEGRFLEINDDFVKLTGYTRQEVIGSTSTEMGIWEHGQRERAIAILLETGCICEMEISFRIKSGEVRIGSLSGKIIFLNGEPCLLAMTQDITERKVNEDNLKYLSLHNFLTGLYNRTYFEQEMSRLESGRHLPVGMIICDVDGLKLVNDTLGHKAGDDLLINAANTIRECFREEDVVARIGGDEFAILLPGSNLESVENACNRIKQAIADHNAKESGLPLSISCGFAVSDDNSVNVNDLFRIADYNMYREKLHRRQSTHQVINKTKFMAVRKRRD